MRKQISYNDDLSLLGQRVRPIQPRTPASGDRYRLYGPTSGDHHQQHRPPPGAVTRAVERNVNFAPAKPACKKSATSSKPVARAKPTYSLKINNVDDVTVPVSGGHLMKICEARSVHELRGLLHTCTSSATTTTSPAAAAATTTAVRPLKASPAATALRTAGVHAYEQCFLGHCIALRDALTGPTTGP